MVLKGIPGDAKFSLIARNYVGDKQDTSRVAEYTAHDVAWLQETTPRVYRQLDS